MGVLSESIDKRWGQHGTIPTAYGTYREHVVDIIATLEDSRDLHRTLRRTNALEILKLEDEIALLKRANDSLDKQRRTAWASDNKLRVEIDRLYKSHRRFKLLAQRNGDENAILKLKREEDKNLKGENARLRDLLAFYGIDSDPAG